MDKDKVFFKSKSDRIIQLIKRELSIDVEERAAQISSHKLEHILFLIEELKKKVLKGKLPPKEDRHAILTRVIIDTWPLGTKLGNEISELEEIYQNM